MENIRVSPKIVLLGQTECLSPLHSQSFRVSGIYGCELFTSPSLRPWLLINPRRSAGQKGEKAVEVDSG